MIETGFELLDVLIKTVTARPLESIMFTVFIVFSYKFFNREMRHDLWRGIESWVTIDVRYFLPRLINNKEYSYCRINVDMIERVFMIIKTRYAFNWRQREIISEETGLHNDEITQIIHVLKNQGKIESDNNYRLVVRALP